MLSSIMMMMTFSILISLIMMLFYLMNKKESWDKLSSSMFECGFNSFIFNRYSFSTQYFLISLIFILLDMEFCIMIPYLFSNSISMKMMNYLITMALIVLMGLIMEWKTGSLNWKE